MKTPLIKKYWKLASWKVVYLCNCVQVRRALKAMKQDAITCFQESLDGLFVRKPSSLRETMARQRCVSAINKLPRGARRDAKRLLKKMLRRMAVSHFASLAY